MTHDSAENAAIRQPEGEMSTRVAALVGSRLCHDLVSPLGAICNGVELLQMAGDWPGLAESEEITLIEGALSAARARLSCFRIAFGAADKGQNIPEREFRQLISEIETSGRMRIALQADGDHPRIEAKMVLLALMCLESAMPWGAAVTITKQNGLWHLRGDAGRTRHDAALWRWLSNDDAVDRQLEPPASEIHFPLLGITARESGRMTGWSLTDTGAEINF